MSRRGLAFAIAMAAALLCAGVISSSAQTQPTKAPEDKSRKTRREDNRAFRDWPKTEAKLESLKDQIGGNQFTIGRTQVCA